MKENIYVYQLSQQGDGKTHRLTVTDPTASVGDQISVTMKIAADAALGSSDVMLQYDADALEFVSGTKACSFMSTTDGTIPK